MSILGARVFFGRPLKELTNRAVPLVDLMGPAARVLCDRLHEAARWKARFALMDLEIARRVSQHQAPVAEVTWAWRQLRSTVGRIPIGTLVHHTGWSRKHVISRFRDELGLAPKTLGRVLRFARAVEVLKAGRALCA